MHLAQKALANQSFFGYSSMAMDGLKVSEGLELFYLCIFFNLASCLILAFFSTMQINSIFPQQNSIICWELSTPALHLMKKSSM